MTVHLNLGQMLAIVALVHKMEWIHNHSIALKMGRFPDMCQPVVAFSSGVDESGVEYKFHATGKISVNGINSDVIGVGTHFTPVIPVWWGDKMDDIWADMYVTSICDWQSEDFDRLDVVANVWNIIQGV